MLVHLKQRWGPSCTMSLTCYTESQTGVVIRSSILPVHPHTTTCTATNVCMVPSPVLSLPQVSLGAKVWAALKAQSKSVPGQRTLNLVTKNYEHIFPVLWIEEEDNTRTSLNMEALQAAAENADRQGPARSPAAAKTSSAQPGITAAAGTVARASALVPAVTSAVPVGAKQLRLYALALYGWQSTAPESAAPADASASRHRQLAAARCWAACCLSEQPSHAMSATQLCAAMQASQGSTWSALCQVACPALGLLASLTGGAAVPDVLCACMHP